MRIRSYLQLVPLCAAAVALAGGLSSCKKPDRYSMADTDNDGTVDQAEFDRYVREQLYAAGDADGNSRITFEEWLITNPDAKREKFDQADTDGDGAITPEEATVHFESTGMLDDLFAKIDTDSSGDMSRAEADAFMEKMQAQAGTRIQQLKKAASES